MEIDSLTLAPFEGLPLWAIAFVYLSVFFGFFVRGAFGFGSNMPIVLLITWVLGPHHTVFVVAVMAMICQIHLLPQGPRYADWKVVLPLVPGMGAGIWLSTWVLGELDGDNLMAVMGLLVLSIVVMDRLRLIDRLADTIDLRGLPVSLSLATISGALGTLSGGGGIYFLAGYLKHACPDPAVFRATNILVAGSFMLVRFSTLALVGFIAFEYIVEALLLLPAIFGGTWAGGKFFENADSATFYAALQWLMLIAAIALILGGIAASLK